MKNIKDAKRFLVFGDIHGMYDKLMNTWDKIKFNPDEDQLLFLGDYIDRGKDSIKCLDFVMDKVNNYNAIALRGNHEQMCLDYYHNNENGEIWVYPNNGGISTNRKFHKMSEEEFNKYLNFIEDLPLYYELGNFIFCHAGINTDIDNWKEDPFSLVWIREKFLFGYNGDKIICVGHTPVQSLYHLPDFRDESEDNPQPLTLDNNIIMMDTGSFLPNGKISCMDILNGDVFN